MSSLLVACASSPAASCEHTHVFSSGRMKPIELSVSAPWNIRKHHRERKNVTAGVLMEWAPPRPLTACTVRPRAAQWDENESSVRGAWQRGGNWDFMTAQWSLIRSFSSLPLSQRSDPFHARHKQPLMVEAKLLINAASHDQHNRLP